MRNTATIASVGHASLAACILVMLMVSLAEATYGPRTTIGNNYQQWSNEEAQVAFTPGNCGASVCYLLFGRIPKQRAMIVQHIGCSLRVGTSGNIFQAYLGTRKGPTAVLRRTPLTPVRTTGGDWAINSQVMHLFESGERPYVFFEAQGNTPWLINCSISGRFQQP